MLTLCSFYYIFRTSKTKNMKNIMSILISLLFLCSCNSFSSEKTKMMRHLYPEIFKRTPGCKAVQEVLDRSSAITNYDVWISIDSLNRVHTFYTNADTLFEK